MYLFFLYSYILLVHSSSALLRLIIILLSLFALVLAAKQDCAYTHMCVSVCVAMLYVRCYFNLKIIFLVHYMNVICFARNNNQTRERDGEWEKIVSNKIKSKLHHGYGYTHKYTHTHITCARKSTNTCDDCRMYFRPNECSISCLLFDLNHVPCISATKCAGYCFAGNAYTSNPMNKWQ